MTSPPVERRDEELRCDAGASPRPSTAEASAASTLRALADRCEREGPSRDLDFAIGQAVDGFDRLVVDGEEHWGYRGGHATELRRYTACFDDAVTLAPESTTQLAVATKYGAPRPHVAQVNEGNWYAGKNRALALCAAALRARASLLESP